MKKFFVGIIGGFLFVGALYFVVPAAFHKFLDKIEESISFSPSALKPAPTVSTVPSNKTQKTKATDFVLMTRDSDKDGSWDELNLIDDGVFKKINPPDKVDREIFPVSDGKAIYYIIENGKSNGKSLVAVSLDSGKQELISDSTDLVVPRKVFASDNGKTIAFYLDGTAKKMTELWTYDPEKKRKRVSVERLTINAVGPYWDANGGFLLRDGQKILRGSPNRTGMDILSNKFDAQNISSSENSMIPSPGGTQVAYIVEKKIGEVVNSSLRVLDLKEKKEREILTIPSEKVDILGWSDFGALVLRETSDVRTKIWSVTKDSKESYVLENYISSIKLSGDGSYLAYTVVDSASGIENMVICATKTGKIISRKALLSNENAADTNTLNTEIIGENKVIQYLRPTESLEGWSQAAEFPLAQEEIVGYIVEHIRQITEAPAPESVAAQRIWFTQVPGAVYIDYLVGTTLWRRLVQVDGAGEKASQHSIIGVYAPAEGEWVLTRGKELSNPQTTIMYEYESEIGKWVKKDANLK